MNIIDKLLNRDVIKGKKVTIRILDEYKGKIKLDIAKYNNMKLRAKNGDRKELLKTYKDIITDAHLGGIIDLRKERVKSTDFSILKQEGDKLVQSNYDYLFQTKWFYKFLEEVLNVTYYGFSLIEVQGIIQSNIYDIESVNRENVNIIDKVIYVNSSDMEGFPYNTNSYMEWLIELYDNEEDLGKLCDVIPLVIYKRSVMAAWAEYADVFGMPIRIGKTSSNVETDRKRLAHFLEGLSKSAWAVIDEEEQIEFIETAKGDAYNVYDKFIETLNKEMSKRIIGSTLISDGGASYSQGKTHDLQFTLKVKADMRNVEFVINDTLIPYLQHKGLLEEGVMFKFDDSENISLAEQIIIDEKLNNMRRLDKEYLTSKYRVVFEETEGDNNEPTS